jgi:prepilin-type N-terminal cleavage/methylation domain-containing protein
MKDLRPGARRAYQGFTLLELMVSSALIGIMMMVLLSATSAGLGLWRGSEQRIAVGREGRNALFLMADDLDNILVLPAPAPQPRFGHWEDYVFMEFPVLRPRDYQDPAQANSGDVCYVRYRYNYDEKRLSRSHVDSLDTLAALRDGTTPPPGAFEVLADHVTDLTVNTYDQDGQRTTEPARVRTVALSVGVVDKHEAANLERGLSLPESKSSKQYFSVNASVPPAP